MNTAELAKETGLNYQTVSRAVRAVLKAEGSYTKITRAQAPNGAGFQFTPDFEAKVRARLSGRVVNRKKIRSSEVERRKWRAAWDARFLVAGEEGWVAFSVVLAAISHTKVPGWISTRFRRARLGDYVLVYAEQVTTGEDESGFMTWLRENGFESSNTMEIL